MRYPEAYLHLLRAFLRDKVALFGHVAVRRAQAVPGLRVHETGDIAGIDRDPFAVLDDALRAFEKLSGRASTLSARTAVHRLGIRERYPGIELPEGLG